MYSKYSYDRQIHFKECIRKYQGKQIIDSKILHQIDEMFKKHDLIDYTKTSHERYKKVTKSHITMFLRETGNVKYYDDVNFIYKHFTGNQGHDISHLENILIEDFKILAKMYDQKFCNDDELDMQPTSEYLQHYQNKNNIESCTSLESDMSESLTDDTLHNNNKPSPQHKKTISVDCEKSDFNLLKTTERRIRHDELIKDFFQELNWHHTP
eukprot:Pgem_evm5s6026